MSPDLKTRLDAVYETHGDREKLDKAYGHWASDYDKDLWVSGNPYVALMLGLVGRYVPDRQARIIWAVGYRQARCICYLLNFQNPLPTKAVSVTSSISLKNQTHGSRKKRLNPTELTHIPSKMKTCDTVFVSTAKVNKIGLTIDFSGN